MKRYYFKKSKIKEIVIISLLIFVFVLLNISILKYCNCCDLPAQQRWGNAALDEGVVAAYQKAGTDYPPFYIYVLKLNSWINKKIAGDNNTCSYSYSLISKIFPVLSHILISLMVFFYFRKTYDTKKAVLGMSLYLFNFSLIYNFAYWGQVDTINTFFMFLSIYFLMNNRYATSTIFLTLSVLTKIQSIVLLPIVALIVLKNVKLLKIIRLLLINTLVVGIIFLPYILRGAFSNVIQVMLNSTSRWPYATANAYNIWFLLTPRVPGEWGSGLRDNYIFLGVTIKMIGLCLLFFYAFLVAYQLNKKPSREQIVLAASSMALAFYILPTQIHERYMFPFFALLVLLIFQNKKYFWIYMILSASYLLNLMLVMQFLGGNFIFSIVLSLLNHLIDYFSLIKITLFLSVVNVITFAYFSCIGILSNLFKNFKEDMLRIKCALCKAINIKEN